MTKIKLFLDPIHKLEPWLHSIVSQGYRLVDVLNFVYTFEKSEEPYSYSVQYLGSKPHQEVKKYVQFLEEGNYKLFYAPLNQGNIVFGKVRFRPFARGSAKVATSFDRFNREILIVENPGEIPVNLLTTNADRLTYFRTVRGTLLYGFAVLALLLGIVLYNVYDKGISMWSGVSAGVLLAFLFFYLFLLVKNSVSIRKYETGLRQ